MLTSDTPVRPHPSVVFTCLDAAEAALLHLGTKRYYALNETGARVDERRPGASRRHRASHPAEGRLYAGSGET
jgi:hypothetical protein